MAVKVINIEVGHIEVCPKLEVSTNVGPEQIGQTQTQHTPHELCPCPAYASLDKPIHGKTHDLSMFV